MFPPSPPKIPLIDSIHLLAAALPHRSLRDLSAKYGPVIHLQLEEVPAVVVSSPETAKTHDLVFTSRPGILPSEVMSYGSWDIAFAPYGEFWRQIGKICMLELPGSTSKGTIYCQRICPVINFDCGEYRSPSGDASVTFRLPLRLEE